MSDMTYVMCRIHIVDNDPITYVGDQMFENVVSETQTIHDKARSD
jgi:hypothetical protein